MDNQVKLLPFDIMQDSVNYDGRSYLVSRATVDWGDPNGDWKLVVMADLDFLMPFNYKLTVGLSSAFGFFLITLMMLQWRAKLQHAKYKRFKAEEEVKVYSTRLEKESESKSFLSDLTLNFQQTTNHIDFAKVLISNVTPRLTAAYVALYARHTDTNEFHPIGCYGVIENTLKTFELGHGMLGQVAKEGQTLMLDDTSALPIVIQSGLGYNKPKAVLLIPIKQSDDVLGVMVVASLKGFNATQLAFQEALQPLMAGQLNVLNRNVSFATRTDN
jgi:transcriptional regulator with GAF, ATPase, and Fis domain